MVFGLVIPEIFVRYVIHDDVIKWKYFPRYWPFVKEIHRSPAEASDAELWCFLWSAPAQMVEQTIETLVIAIPLIMMAL